MAKTSTKKAEEKVENAVVSEPVEKQTEETAQNAQEAVSDAKPGEDKLTISKSELDALIASAVASALANTAPQIVQVAPTENPVVLLFLGGIMPGSTVTLGELGNIYRDGGTLTVSKDAFFSKLNGTAEFMLRTRQLIVVSGLTDEERGSVQRKGTSEREDLRTASVIQPRRTENDLRRALSGTQGDCGESVPDGY